MVTFRNTKLSDRVRPDIDAARWVVDGIEALEQQLAAAQAEVLEKARIVGMGGEQELDLRQQVELLRGVLKYYANGGDESWIAQTALDDKEPKP